MKQPTIWGRKGADETTKLVQVKKASYFSRLALGSAIALASAAGVGSIIKIADTPGVVDSLGNPEGVSNNPARHENTIVPVLTMDTPTLELLGPLQERLIINGIRALETGKDKPVSTNNNTSCVETFSFSTGLGFNQGLTRMNPACLSYETNDPMPIQQHRRPSGLTNG